jgi:undecaprenyl-diphosphatase
MVLAFMSANTQYFLIDLTITNTLQTLHFPLFSQFMVLVSWFGTIPQSVFVSLIIIAAIYFLGFHWEAVASSGIAVFEGTINTLIKFLIHRPRPAADLVNVVNLLSSYSFPSGHVMYYVAFFGFIWFLIFTLLKKSWIRTLFLSFFGMLILLVGISRIYLGAHWSSDVLGAYFLGTLLLIVGIQFYLWGKNRITTN